MLDLPQELYVHIFEEVTFLQNLVPSCTAQKSSPALSMPTSSDS